MTIPTSWQHLLLISASLFSSALAIPGVPSQQVLKQDSTAVETFDYTTSPPQHPIHPPKPIHALPELLNAVDVLETQYFEIWQGIWPTAIDWTAAVIGTHLSAVLNTLSVLWDRPSVSAKAQENLVNRYFSQLTASYFGQDSFGLRNEAYDDMLWVVLGWLETVNFIKAHDVRHYSGSTNELKIEGQYSNTSAWHGTQWIPAFAHRARIFWDLASKGWDTTLCGGGMIWSPYLVPYKNAITNELFIAASVSMYLYFPGDDNSSPFQAQAEPHDPKYLAAAVEGYRWLSSSNMTDAQGLYVDGYHITGWTKTGNVNTRCDARNEMVYTYNQGVILTGQRGLWEATGARSYLEDGHKLIADVINATGWDLLHDKPYHTPNSSHSQLAPWAGLGRSGVLEEACDSSGTCSQDGQTFKGIFFNHFTTFCRPLPLMIVHPGQPTSPDEPSPSVYDELRLWHSQQCARYRGWVTHNARAAINSKDAEGRFGTWWGIHSSGTGDDQPGTAPDVLLPTDAVDYRNEGVPRNRDWMNMPGPVKSGVDSEARIFLDEVGVNQDLNDRGRGRTVETQSGGIAVLRAMQELVVMQ